MYFKSAVAVLATLIGASVCAQQTNVGKRKLPAYRTKNEIEQTIVRNKNNQQLPQQLQKAGTLPTNMRYPGEFEESQAAIISWPYDYDVNDNPFIDTSTTWGGLWVKLADAIQQEALLVIRVDNANDSIKVKNFMVNQGKPLTNYKFMLQVGDAFWMRDFGPHGFYYGPHDSLGFIDLKYYEGRNYDDVFAKLYAQSLGKPVYTSRLNGEGGNLMTDGFGTVFFSSVYDEINTDIDYVNPPFSAKGVQDTLAALFASKKNVMLQRLSCDGGTGHIDLYLKMIDEQTIMAVKLPDVITASDKKTIEDNFQILASLNGPYNRPYRIVRVPHPTDDAGVYSRKSCFAMDADARTFVNGLTLNKTFIFPSYSTPTSGNHSQLDSVVKLYKKVMPGYKLVDIDARILSPLGGELHCVTMQIPAENPVQFWHPSNDGLHLSFSNTHHIVAKITNRSGIASAKCMWRVKGSPNFIELTLTDSAGYFVGDIVANAITMTDEIEYYLTATTNNGKTAVKPITAPDGYYRIFFIKAVGVDNDLVETKNYLFNAYPNPAKNNLTMMFYAMQSGNAQITVTDVTGKVVLQPILHKAIVGLNEVSTNISELSNGIYFYTYQLNGTNIATCKFVVHK